MVRDSRGLWIVFAVVAVVAIVLWLVIRPQPEPVRPGSDKAGPIPFHFADLSVTSPDLAVGPAEIDGGIYPTYSSWRVTMNCAEPDGCVGEFVLEVKYHAGSETRRIVIINQGQALVNGELRFEGLQDPSTPVDRVDRLSLEVRDRRVLDGEPIEIPL